MKYEYFHLYRTESQDFDETEFLNSKGEEGWELVDVVFVQKNIVASANDQWHYYFKRPKNEPIRQDR